jgi:hypothetical protein
MLCLTLVVSARSEGGAGAPLAPGMNQVTPGELIIDPATLINLGFEWLIEGDDNRNAVVEVSYRKNRRGPWSEALPLLRVQGEEIYSANRLDVVPPNMFAGSILDLEPDTEYEVHFVMSDPDGVSGESRRTVTTRTRYEPMPYAGGRIFHVYPHGYKGKKVEPSYEGLLCAYNTWCAGTDWTTAGRPRVRPGDMILVHAGLYKYNRYIYTNDLSISTVPFDGTYYLTASGTPDRPIVIRAAGDGDVIFDGDGNFNLFNVKAANYTYFEGITFRNTEIAIWAGTQFIAGSEGLTVKRCRFENIGMGIYTNYSGSSNFYIADNYFIGRNDPTHMIGWSGAFWAQFNGVDGQVFPPIMASYVAIKVYGPGHVIAYNYVANFHDGIDTETYGNPDGSSAADGPRYPPRQLWNRRPVSIDYYGNYMTNFHDNPFEIDGSMHNIRVMRNMMINSASHALCNQPALGGPIYWIRNIAYNLPGGSTRLSGGSGILFYNNTILAEISGGTTSNTHWRNNLILGQNSIAGLGGTPGQTGAPPIFGFSTFTNYTSSDYNGFRPNPGAAYSFNGPGHNATLETRRFMTLAEYSTAMNQDQHSVLVDYDIFMNVPRLDAQDLKTVQRVYKAEEFDFRLKPASAAVDRGVVLPNVNQNFVGKAPDLGALEAGGAPLHFGPRP